MTPVVLLAVLGAAFLHAFWNALIKTGGDKQTGMLMLTLGHAAIGAVVVSLRPLPAAEVWPWLIASGLIHMAYQLFLAYAYEHGDLSRVYPIARGTAPLIVAIVGAVVLSDVITGREYTGVAVLGLGILLMAQGVFRNDESRRLLPYALGSACATAGYSLVDGMGARVSGDPVTYVAWLLILSALFYTPVVLALHGRRVLANTPRGWALGGVASAASYVAYAVVVWAMTQAPIALVTALRETSILFAVLIGWVVFREPMQRGKLVAAGLIVLGVVLTRT
ncbi:EamA family transporter [Aliiroseovarius subalbicans]|uniref:EamA family transporter n=1 Tax=Aliiroseovarius subalbicans TaxID=2925840 RepID=UPI001F55E44E|nr:EamA family transporter [Aliiroseovarius subalbicans]MCI2400472.1 DMT family transporter [Aliiroseovarius subalbicans]